MVPLGVLFWCPSDPRGVLMVHQDCVFVYKLPLKQEVLGALFWKIVPFCLGALLFRINMIIKEKKSAPLKKKRVFHRYHVCRYDIDTFLPLMTQMRMYG